jgi:cell division protein FtsQ
MAVTAQPGFLEGVRLVRFALWLSAGICLMVATLVIWHQTEQFLIRDQRFQISLPDDLAGHSPDLLVEGIHYASASQIRHVFSEDFDRSLYLVPIETRRRQLLALDWVEDAAVSKIWPKTLKVRIRERIPVAFVHLPPNARDGISHFALIDRDGYVLRPRIPAKFTLPVITGIRETERLADRRAKVHRVLGMLKDIGSLAEQISEINVADPNNLIAAEHVDNRVVNLMLGDENYSERLQNFLGNYGEIKGKRPDVKTLDLRIDGVITAVGESHGK